MLACYLGSVESRVQSVSQKPAQLDIVNWCREFCTIGFYTSTAQNNKILIFELKGGGGRKHIL